MCLKYTELSPRAFIRDKRWKSVIRRCAQVSSRGQLQGCDWGYDSRGTYWEQCYCTQDGCNSVSRLHIARPLFLLVPALFWFLSLHSRQL
ncbi:hypothetical protein RvY_17739-2 [Ramazzottius varieornatus]|uniref:Protein quiver n=1 Tax=Ramazzottius varieornatus TaxID=947166 RepID=A0A1D1W3V3_RAMVA|nr:hypothetical protein RvY_17739-2 [Ramazzottius varieornatus]